MEGVEGVDSAWSVFFLSCCFASSFFSFSCRHLALYYSADSRTAIATKRHGWVTNEDKLEALMEGTPSTKPENVDWGPDGGY